ncbi:MAG: ATP-binding protein [Lachnospiraceae bacterium]|nr:ATP-binding protein [Lachnospiraceae bacterium]
MHTENPFTITFGKQPNKLISRYEDTDEIVSTFSADNAVSQTFLIEGIRGSGKTVLMTTVSKILGEKKDWIVINLNPTMDLLESFAVRLNDACNSKPELLSKGFNISAAGFGIGVNGEERSTDHVGMIDKLFKSLIRKDRKVLITIDEVVHNNNMKVFASQFQIFIRQDYPLFLIMTGLHENIYEIQNDPALTFLLRSPKIITGPLSILQITKQYKNIFGTDEIKARELAYLTRGFAFAFQALGVSYWNNREAGMEAVLEEFDELLDDFVYKKIWSSLTTREREIVRAINTDEVKASEICVRTGISNSSWSQYREMLVDKGIIETPRYAYVSLTLPRFNEVTANYRI